MYCEGSSLYGVWRCDCNAIQGRKGQYACLRAADRPAACTVFAAKIVGCLLPLLAKKIGFDPAVMASPFITTIVDALSLLIYFRFATVLLGI